MINLYILIFLLKISISFCQYFIMTPLDHSYCIDRSKSVIMNTLSVGHKKITMKIDPNVKSLQLSKSNSLCPATLIQPLGKLVRHVIDRRSSWSFWHLSLKIYGQFSSCADYIMIGEIGDDYTDNDVRHAYSVGMRLHCRSQLPAVIQVNQRQILIWWHWSKETQPKFVLEISAFIRFEGKWDTVQKIKVCDQSMGFWCGTTCIHGGMRCNGVNDCDSFTLKETSIGPSADENNCQEYVNVTGVPIEAAIPYYESAWIGRSLYILLGVTILILLVSASKICLHNSNIDSRLHKSQSVASIQSSSSSSNYDKPEDEEVYEELPICSESVSKRSHSANISIDEDTHEELLVASNECLEHNSGTEMFPIPLINQSKKTHTYINDTEPQMTTFVQVHSLSSSRYQSNSSIQGPLITPPITTSLTGNILAQGQDVIARLNLPSSTKNFRNKLWKKLRTSSYDKINEGTMSEQMSVVAAASELGTDNNKPKCRTISRLEMNKQNGVEEDEYLTSYVIV